jgi:hypothetical protein
MLDEYLDGDELERRPERVIPIRQRCEFLPSVGPELPELEPAFGPQLELRLTTTPACAPEPAAAQDKANLAVGAAPVETRVNRPPKLVFTPVDHRRRSRQKLTPGGFILGCAMGSAAAALVLLVVQFAVG